MWSRYFNISLMDAVKLISFAPNPNVGIGLLTLALLFGPHPAEAAYTVVEDEGMTGLDTTPTVSVPFYLARHKLGPRGRAAMEDALQSARIAHSIEIVARGDKAGDLVLSRRRGATLKEWFASHGVSPARVNVRLEAFPQPDSEPKVYLAEVRFMAAPRERTAYATVEAPAPVTAAPVNNSPLMENILQLHRSGQLSDSAAIRLLSTLSQPAPLQSARTTITPTMPTSWTLKRNVTLKDNLTSWATAAGWNPPDWRLADPYHVDQTIVLHGSLVDAITEVSKAVPSLDFLISQRYRTITVTGAESK